RTQERDLHKSTGTSRSLKMSRPIEGTDDGRRVELQLPAVQQSPLLHVQARGRRRLDEPRGPLPRMSHCLGRGLGHSSEVTKAYALPRNCGARVRFDLFPLHAVLFPEATRVLQIFDPRYREMIGRRLAHAAPSG